jgi:hypothetical protein
MSEPREWIRDIIAYRYKRVMQWKAPHFGNGWLSVVVALIDTNTRGGHGQVIVTVHRKGRKAEVPLGGSHQILDSRVVRQACEELGLDWLQLPGLKGRV